MNSSTPLRPALLLLAAFAAAWPAPARADSFLVPDPTGDRIARVNSAGVVSTLIGTGLDTPEQVAADAEGNLYVADSGAGKVLQYPAAGGGPTQIGDAVAGVTALAFDAAGVLHVAVPGDRTIRKLNGNAFQTVVTLPAGTPRSIAFDPANGDLYIADSTGNKIHKSTGGGAPSVFSNDVTTPFAVAFDATGKLHASDAQAGGRIVFFAGGNANNNAKEVARNLGAIRGLAFDRANDAHFLTSGGELRKVTGKTTSLLIANGLGDARLLTVRSPVARLVAINKKAVPELGNVQFASFGPPAIGGGLVAFKATLLPPIEGVASSNAPGLWSVDAAGTTSQLARKTFALPGDPGSTVVSVTDPVLNHNGKIAFTARYTNGSTAGVALITDAAGAPLGPLVRKGEQAPGLAAGVKFTAFKQLVLADDAGPAFLATVAGPGITAANNLGLWSTDAAGNVSLVLQKGAPLTVGGKPRTLGTLWLFTGTPMSLGQGRHAALGRQFTFTAKFTDGFSAILLAQPGSAPMVLAEKSGDVGAIADAKFAGFGSPCVSKQADAFGFLGKLVPNLGGATTANAGAILTQAGGANELEARKLSSAPGVPDAIFATLGDPVLGPSGSLAFFGRMKPGFGGVLSSTAAGLWQDTGSGLGLAARQGIEGVPGIKGAVKFTAFKQFVLPDTGGVIFLATVAGTGVTTSNNLGLWASDGAGGLDLLIRKGDKITLDGQARTVGSFAIFKAAPGVTGQSRQFDNAGSVALQVTCSDGTKAILAFHRP